MGWNVDLVLKKLPKMESPIFIEGLPGIGNVGKIVADFIVEELKAKKIIDFSSFSFPNSVFVNSDNLVELPTVEMYYKKGGAGKKDLLLLVGDVQPVDEVASYEFCNVIIDFLKKNKVEEIVTMGGIGLPNIPKVPKVFCTGNSKDVVKKYKKEAKVDTKIFGIVGPIMGATGLLVGMSKKEKIPAACLLAETYGHPMFLGIKGSREILKVLVKVHDLKLNLKKLDKEIKDIESELKKTKDVAFVQGGRMGKKGGTDYIG